MQNKTAFHRGFLDDMGRGRAYGAPWRRTCARLVKSLVRKGFLPMPNAKALTATNVLIAINVIVFLVEWLAPYRVYQAIDAQALTTYVVLTGNWHTLVTSMFMHSGLQHLLSNMIGLYWVGTLLEEVYGPVRMLVLYFVSGIAGGLAFVAINLLVGQPAACVGASGAIFGLFAAYALLLVCEHRRHRLLARPTTKQDVTAFLTVILLNVALGFAPGVAWRGHLGGMVAGLAVGAVLYAGAVRRVRAAHRG